MSVRVAAGLIISGEPDMNSPSSQTIEVDPEHLLRGIAEASEAIVNLELDYTSGMGACLKALGLALQADRVYLFEAHSRPTDGELLMSQRFEWSRDAVEPQIDNPELQDVELGFFHGWEASFRRGEPISFTVAEHPQPEVREFLQEQDIIALLLVPITVAGEFWGFIGFDDCTYVRNWREAELLALTAVANTIGSAIVRTRTYQTMLEISTPILRLWEGVVAVPMVGRLTRERAAQLTDALLSELASNGAHEAVIDITGMSEVASAEVELMLRTIRAAHLLGTRCTVVGVQPQVASTLITSGVNVDGLHTAATLEDALREIFSRRPGGPSPLG